MSLTGHFPDGYYDDNGDWQRSKFCFVSCGDACTCMPPFGVHYSAAHDKRLARIATGGFSGPEGSGRTRGVKAPDALHMPVETTDEAAQGTGPSVSEGEQHG